MELRNRSVTCLTRNPHSIIKDPVLHYSGCLNEESRQRYLESLEEDEKALIQEAERRRNRILFNLRNEPEVEEQIDALSGLLCEFRKLHRGKKQADKAQKSPTRTHTPASHTGDATGSSVITSTEATGSDILGTLEDGFDSPVVYFKDGQPYSDPGFPGKFPRQHVPLSTLLFKRDEGNPLMGQCKEGMIRWFHIPANNMQWVEEAIARHYREERPNHDDLFQRPKSDFQTHELLRHVFWRGHRRKDFTSGAVYMRHLEPLCEKVPIPETHGPNVHQNIALFTPYLHWDTDYGRRQLKSSIKTTMEAADLASPNTATGVSKTSLRPNPQRKRENRLSISTIVDEALECTTPMGNIRPRRVRIPRGTPTTRGLILFHILMHAARLYEMVAYYEDQHLVKEYLLGNPPLHPRRTLHQYSNAYSFLKSTDILDNGQVVCKATAPLMQAPRHHCSRTYRCQTCMRDIRPVPKILMVDQLWLFILNENTIITSFPQRWGTLRSENPSGVMERIRLRLSAEGKREVLSPYDLALIIFDICCRTFYENVPYDDEQPFVYKIFEDAISDITSSELHARNHTWKITDRLSNAYARNDESETVDLHKSLLNINPEAALLNQAESITSELEIFTCIKETQRRVLKDFHLHVAEILLPGFSRPKDYDRVGMSQSETCDIMENLRKYQKDEKDDRAKFIGVTWTLSCANDFELFFQEQHNQILRLSRAASHVANMVRDSVSLKDRHATLIASREAVNQGVEVTDQGRSIMLFSIFTAIFLPLSFCSSIFGMNVQDYTEGLGTLRQELKWMFPTSVAFTFVACMLSFHQLSLAVLLYTLTIPTKWVVARLAELWPWVRPWLAGQNYKLVNQKRYRRVRYIEEYIQRLKAVRQSDLFWQEVGREQEKRRSAARYAGRKGAGLGDNMA